ncbi:Qat anti-phage system TatD family nuclease QatD [Sulfuricurvum sp.]|uniref:Qat anti-phage system TatD family nuclease QatD n=1 Tax=Sulfuricurvum sp. TaxID=2025608 RepID=UPI002619B04D|nr:Qat anti-phage system TatD family nuclease QatD [Sulfuricurvum sp.]MDD2781354.1 TatD family hydrolase [Sulfuricurvum sp.]
MIDMHTHLDLYPDALKILDKVNKDNLFTLAVTTSPRAWVATSKVFEKYKNIHVSVGLHPEIVEVKANELDLLIECIKITNFVGEVGIDGSNRFSKSLSLQTRIFERVLQECESQNGKIISIHTRGAEATVLNLLSKYPNCGIPILHWFTGKVSELEHAIELDCWFSINPSMCKTQRGLSLIAKMPKNRILPESDGPFATVKNNTIYPWEAINVASALEKIWQCRNTDVILQLQTNLNTILEAIDE